MTSMAFSYGPALLGALVKGNAWSNRGFCSIGTHQGVFPHPSGRKGFPIMTVVGCCRTEGPALELGVGRDAPAPPY